MDREQGTNGNVGVMEAVPHMTTGRRMELGIERKGGIRFPRVYTRPGMSPFDEVEWELRTAAISNESGQIVFGRMEQPIPTVTAVNGTESLFRLLGIARSELPVELYDNGSQHIFVSLPS